MITDRSLPYHYRQLISWIERETQPLDAKLIVVPTKQIGYELTTAMASLSDGWLNLEALPLGTIATRIVQFEKPMTDHSARTIMSKAAMPFLLEQILADVRRESGVPLNRAAGAFARTISDLRTSRISPDEYIRSSSGPFSETMSQVYERYLDALNTLDLMDEADVYSRATEIVKAQADSNTSIPGLFDSVAVLDEVELSDVAHDFVRALISRSQTAFRIGPEKSARLKGTLSPLMAGRRLSDWSVPVVDSNARPAQTGIKVLKAVDADNEIRTVFRSIVESQIPLDQVEIACTVGDPYVRIARHLSDRYNMPLTVATGIRAVDTRAGALARAYLLWIIEGKSSLDLVRLLRSGLVQVRQTSGQDVNPDSIHEWASLLAQMPIRGSLERYQIALDRIKSRSSEKVSLLKGTFREQKAKAELSLCDQIEKTLWPLIALADRIDTNSSLSDMCSMISTLLYTYAPISDEAEDSEGNKDPEFVARQELIARFDGLATQLPIRLPSAVLLARSLEVITGAVVYARSARSGKIHLSPLASAGFTGRPHVYVVGLDNQTGASGHAEDPLFSDVEKEAATGEGSGRMIPQARFRSSSLRDQLTRATARFDGSIHLIYSAYELASDRETGASAALMSVSGLTEEERDSIQIDSFVPSDKPGLGGRILDTTDMLLNLGTQRDPAGSSRRSAASLVESAYPWMAAGIEASRHRLSADWTPFDGLVGTAGKSLNLFSGKSRLSASRLETLMACGYKYFLRYVLWASEPDEPDEDVWMDARMRGTIVHDVLQDFMEQAVRTERALDIESIDDNITELSRLFVAAVDAYGQRVEAPNPATRGAVLSEFNYVSRAFVQDEAKRNEHARPREFELAFGISPAAKQSPSDPTDVYRLNLNGLEFNFQGRIDRIDELKNGHLAITDYKTGSSYAYDPANLLSNGKSLQWALYAYVVEELLGAPVASSGYLFPGKKELGLRIESDPGLVRNEIASLLRHAGLRVQEGHFLQAADPAKACTFCDYLRVCGDAGLRKQQLEQKISATEPGDIMYESLSNWAYAEKKLNS
jgi:hypothetical protein